MVDGASDGDVLCCVDARSHDGGDDDDDDDDDNADDDVDVDGRVDGDCADVDDHANTDDVDGCVEVCKLSVDFTTIPTVSTVRRVSDMC